MRLDLLLLAVPVFSASVALAQNVTATASASTQLSAGILVGSLIDDDTRPAGTDLTPGVSLFVSGTAVDFSGSLVTATASADFSLATVGRVTTYTIVESASVTGGFSAAIVGHETLLVLNSAQAVSGLLTADFVGDLPTCQIDVGNDGGIDWTASSALESWQLPVSFSGSLEVRVITGVGASGLSSLNVDHTLTLKFEDQSASCTQRNGSGLNPVACTCQTLPVIGTSWEIAVAPGPNTLATLAFASPAPIPGVNVGFGELLIDPAVVDLPGNGTHTAVLANDPAFLGVEFSVQGLRVDVNGGSLELQLTDAQDAVVGL